MDEFSQRSMQTNKRKHIGIIGDSHGRADMIEKAVTFLKRHHCEPIIHLGDICDSFSPKTCDPCLDALMDHDVIALKGNNDHVLEVNQAASNDAVLSAKSLTYLRQLSPVMAYEQVVFAHSLPFYRDLGISCITRFLGEAEIRRFFSTSDHQILFRGHGHDPEIVWEENSVIHYRGLETGSETDLGSHIPCIITCGALTRGLAMIWDQNRNILKNLSFL